MKYAAEKIAPFVKCDQKTGTYFIYSVDYWLRKPPSGLHAYGTPYQQVGYGVTNGTFNCQEFGFQKFLSDAERKASQTPEDLQLKDTQYVTNMMQLDIESAVASKLWTTSVWGTDKTGGTDFTMWDDYADSDPIHDIKAGRMAIKRRVGIFPNTLMLGVSAFEQLIEHPLLLDKFKYTMKGILTEDLLADVFKVEEVISADASYISSAEGQSTIVGADIWGPSALLLCRNNPTLGVANGAYTFIWDEVGNFPWAVQTYRDEGYRGNQTRCFTHRDTEVVSSIHGYFMSGVVNAL
jgi:hypothetical protein